MVNTADVSRAAPVNTARRCSVSGLVERQLYMWCVQVYPCDCLKTEDFWRGSFWDVRFSPACRACKDEISSGWWRAASEQQIKTRRDMQAARDRQIIREGRSRRHTDTHRRSDKHTEEMDVLVKLLYVLRKRWISSSSCSIFSTLHLQWADVRCEPAQQPPEPSSSPEVPSGSGERLSGGRERVGAEHWWDGSVLCSAGCLTLRYRTWAYTVLCPGTRPLTLQMSFSMKSGCISFCCAPHV